MSDRPAGEERPLRLLAVIAQHRAASDASNSQVLCTAAVEILEVAGAGLSVHGPSGAPYSVAVAGPDMSSIHELERTLGEGPCIDAFRSRDPVIAPDLSNASSLRWPAFCAEVLRTTARAAFGYPLEIGGTCFGALNLYNTEPGPLTSHQHEDALALAGLGTRTILSTLDPGHAEVADARLVDAIHGQVEVHQATGMVSAQLGVPVADALALLRARAFAENRALGDVAADVVSRRLRFDP